MIRSMMTSVFSNITITDVLETINKQYQNTVALRIKTKDGVFREISFGELGRKVVGVSSTLIRLGMTKNDTIAILSENRPEWAIAFFGIFSCAGIVVPIDVKSSEREIQFILNDSHAKYTFVSEKYIGVIDKLKDVLPSLKNVILLDDSIRTDLILLKDMRLRPKADRYNPIYPSDTALIVYTSGTTGVAKGVELTYKNLMFQVLALSGVIRYSSNDQFLSILPLNHMLEITGGLIAPLYTGATVTYADTLKATSILSLMKETHTTCMISVPLALKMLRDTIFKKAEALSEKKRRKFKRALKISKALLKVDMRIGKILFKPLHDELGGCLRGFISGGAPLARDVEIDLNALGFRVLQGYGLTESAPVISVNTFKEKKFGSVGKPLPGVEVKILNPSTTEGEIITKGPHVMKGYYKNHQKTKEVLKNGWLYTGDIGYLDRDGFLFVSGRIKNMIVLGAGKKVYPEEVEELMEKSPYIKEICVMGNLIEEGPHKGHEEVFAAIFPNMDYFSYEEAKNKTKIRDIISKEIKRLSNDLADYKRISGFEIFYEELPKTASRKIKRREVAQLLGRKMNIIQTREYE